MPNSLTERFASGLRYLDSLEFRYDYWVSHSVTTLKKTYHSFYNHKPVEAVAHLEGFIEFLRKNLKKLPQDELKNYLDKDNDQLKAVNKPAAHWFRFIPHKQIIDVKTHRKAQENLFHVLSHPLMISAQVTKSR